ELDLHYPLRVVHEEEDRAVFGEVRHGLLSGYLIDYISGQIADARRFPVGDVVEPGAALAQAALVPGIDTLLVIEPDSVRFDTWEPHHRAVLHRDAHFPGRPLARRVLHHVESDVPPPGQHLERLKYVLLIGPVVLRLDPPLEEVFNLSRAKIHACDASRPG